MIGTLQLFSLTGMAFVALASLSVALLVRARRPALAEVAPIPRRRSLAWLAATPPLLTAAGLLACVLPSALAIASSHGDHCGHHEGHPHLCPWHPPAHTSLLGWGVLGAVAIWLMLRGAPHLVALWRGHRAANALLAQTTDAGSFRRIASPEPFAAAVGLLAPVVLVSRGLEEHVSPAELEAVLAHERGHVRRKDALVLCAARLLWSPLPAMLAGPLLSELAEACEEAADREAAQAVGDELIVADAILAVSRLRAVPLWGPVIGFEAHATARRVKRLMDPATGRTRWGGLAVLGLALLTLALAEPLHHGAETMLGVLAH